MALLIVPLVIALAGWWLSGVSTRNQQQTENQRAQAQQQIEDDRVQHALLQSYIQDMTELLLDKGLATSELNSPVRQIARSSTLIALRQLDGDRKGLLLRFLSESNLIKRTGHPLGDPHPIISLSGADLEGADLPFVDLSEANLVGANLSGANLDTAKLCLANLEGATLIKTNLDTAVLENANLRNAKLQDARNWTKQQLGQAMYLDGAALPDGAVITEHDTSSC